MIEENNVVALGSALMYGPPRGKRLSPKNKVTLKITRRKRWSGQSVGSSWPGRAELMKQAQAEPPILNAPPWGEGSNGRLEPWIFLAGV